MRLLSPSAARILSTFLTSPTGRFYGYQLLQATDMKSGSLYPILGRFESLGWIRGEMQESPGSRPPRRVYQLDPDGATQAKEALDRFKEESGSNPKQLSQNENL